MSRLLLSTVPGLESAAAAELRQEHGLEPEFAESGWLVASVDDAELPVEVATLNHCLRCVDRVGVLLAAGSAAGLDEIDPVARSVRYQRWIDAGERFAVRAVRRGQHDYGSPDVGRVVGQAVIDAYRRATGHRLEVDLDDPDVIFRAEVRGSAFRLSLETTGDDDLSRRAYREYCHMASMRPVVANLLLRLGGWRGEELVDPLCGSATIPIEAALRARGVAPGAMRGRGWAWQRLSGWSAAPRDCGPPLVDPDAALRIHGIERFDRHLQGAWRNQAAAGLVDEIRVARGLAERLDEVLPPAGHRRLVVTNPPFGRRVASADAVHDLYGKVVAACRRVRVDRIVTLSERGATMAAALEGGGYGIARRLPATYGTLAVEVFVADLASA